MNPVTRGLAHFAALALVISAHVVRAADPLPSWRDGPAKKSILDFVAAVSSKGGTNFVPLPERIAVFDNDGTLWAEQPMYFQFLFTMDRLKALAPQHPEWQTNEPFASALHDDISKVTAAGVRGMLEFTAATHGGMTTEEFDQIVKNWLATARHPRFNRPFTEMAYQPMLELLSYLRQNGFTEFVVSGGGTEFMRAFAEQVYGIPPERIIGSRVKTTFEPRDGHPVIMRHPELDYIDDKEGKAIAIASLVGRRPVAAFGNSDGDLQMLQWTAGGSGARFCLYVHHDDPDREWAYDRQSKIGRLDKGWDEANARGWTVVSMKNDWNRIFAFETNSPAK